MFNVCPGCGIYSADKAVDPAGPFAVCVHCGYKHSFVQLPLFLITGASGTGKTAVCLELASRLNECVFLECDILWQPEFSSPQDDYRRFRESWLRVAKNINQARRPTVLCGSATSESYDRCIERRYFGPIHTLALICQDDVLIRRLKDRPDWRQASSEAFIARILEFNRWLIEHAQRPHLPMTLLDTSHLTPLQAGERAAGWIRSYL